MHSSLCCSILGWWLMNSKFLCWFGCQFVSLCKLCQAYMIWLFHFSCSENTASFCEWHCLCELLCSGAHLDSLQRLVPISPNGLFHHILWLKYVILLETVARLILLLHRLHRTLLWTCYQAQYQWYSLLILHFWFMNVRCCKGNCRAELNPVLAGDPKLIYCNE